MMYITKTDLEIAWLMFKDWFGETFGRRLNFTLCPQPQEEFVR